MLSYSAPLLLADGGGSSGLFCSKFTYLLFFSFTDFLHQYLIGKPSITQRAVASQLVLIANAYNPGMFGLNRDEILLYCETHKAAERLN